MKSFKRASGPEQKELRRRQILDAARQLFSGNDFQSVTISQIARGSDLCKGSVFVYFRTKEEVFLALALEEMEKWFDSIDGKLTLYAADNYRMSRLDLVALLRASLIGNDIMSRLVAIVGTALERNVSYEFALSYKMILKTRMEKTGAFLDETVDFFQPGDGVQLISYLFPLVCGTRQLADPAPVIRQVLEVPGFEMFCLEYEPALMGMIELLLLGMEKRSQQTDNDR